MSEIDYPVEAALEPAFTKFLWQGIASDLDPKALSFVAGKPAWRSQPSVMRQGKIPRARLQINFAVRFTPISSGVAVLILFAPD